MENYMLPWSDEIQNQFLAAISERFVETNTVSKVFPRWSITQDMTTVPDNLVESLEDGSLLVDTATTVPQTRIWTNILIPEEQIERADELAMATIQLAAIGIAVGLDMGVLLGTNQSVRPLFAKRRVRIRSGPEVIGLINIPPEKERIPVPPITDPQGLRIWSTNTNAQAARALAELEDEGFFGEAGMFVGRDLYHDLMTPLTENEIPTPYDALSKLFSLGIHNTPALTKEDLAVVVRPMGTADLALTSTTLEPTRKDDDRGTWIFRVTIGFAFRLMLPAVKVLELQRPVNYPKSSAKE